METNDMVDYVFQNVHGRRPDPDADKTELKLIKKNLEYIQQRNEAALNYDGGKLRYDLIPADALEELVKVYTAGAEKYADRNWEKGMAWTRAFGSLQRHAWAWMRGEDIDAESGIHHMAHAAFRCLQLLAYAKRSVGEDDRPGGGE